MFGIDLLSSTICEIAWATCSKCDVTRYSGPNFRPPSATSFINFLCVGLECIVFNLFCAKYIEKRISFVGYERENSNEQVMSSGTNHIWKMWLAYAVTFMLTGSPTVFNWIGEARWPSRSFKNSYTN